VPDILEGKLELYFISLISSELETDPSLF